MNLLGYVATRVASSSAMLFATAFVVVAVVWLVVDGVSDGEVVVVCWPQAARPAQRARQDKEARMDDVRIVPPHKGGQVSKLARKVCAGGIADEAPWW